MTRYAYDETAHPPRMERTEGHPLSVREAVAWTVFGLALLTSFLVLLIQDQAAI